MPLQKPIEETADLTRHVICHPPDITTEITIRFSKHYSKQSRIRRLKSRNGGGTIPMKELEEKPVKVKCGGVVAQEISAGHLA